MKTTSSDTCGQVPGQAQEKGFVFAHRGGSFEQDENTLAAFKASYEKGLRGFETDVRMTKDGVLIILHDDRLDRTCDGTGHVEERNGHELRETRTKKTGQPLLFLDTLLDYFADKPGLYLELEMKTGNKVLYPDERLEEYCQRVYDSTIAKRPKGSTYVFTSFDTRPLKILMQHHPDADLLLTSSDPCSEQMIMRARELGIRRIGCTMDGTSRAAVKAAQAVGLKVTGWPGHTLEDYLLGVGLGLDAICTDIPVAIHTWKHEHFGKQSQ